MHIRAFVFVAILLFVLLTQSALGDVVVLQDGTRIQGIIVKEDETLVVIESKSMGRLELARRDVKSIEYLKPGTFSEVDPCYNSIMFCPTTATLPKGSFYFRDFELFIINFGYAMTNTTNLSFGTHFPVTGSLEFFTAGVKQQILDRETNPIGLAASLSGTFYDDGSFGTGAIIVGVGDKNRSLNVSLMEGFNENDESGIILLVGADARLSQNIKLIGEYVDVSSFTSFDDDDEYIGLINVGIRFFGRQMAFSLTGFRPLRDTGDFIAFPMASFSYLW
ncbi:MAG: hypothetical protein KJ927_18125 [Candidatus Eisenbacteria bacterium]|nr:hypothetical protein [Candidatus Eisenbacteria bacterium]MBU1950637.1 hypothetical protein [Candidatus Eisenbacteria bacterium]